VSEVITQATSILYQS